MAVGTRERERGVGCKWLRGLQRRSDPVRGSEGVDGTGGNGVVTSGSVRGIDVDGEEEEDDDEDDEVS